MTEPFVTSAPIETRGNHDHVRVFVQHKLAGELVVDRGDGPLMQARLLLAEAHPDVVDPSERPTPVPPPGLVEMLRKGPINIDDVPWLCKDFAVLYRVAKATLDLRGLDDTFAKRGALRLQIERLAPAFDQCESVRLRVQQRGAQR